jgi:hypothetical protein
MQCVLLTSMVCEVGRARVYPRKDDELALSGSFHRLGRDVAGPLRREEAGSLSLLPPATPRGGSRECDEGQRRITGHVLWV